mgnify:FL=1
MHLSPVPDFIRLGFGRRAAEEQTAQSLFVKGKEGPEITEAAEGRGCGNGKQDEKKGSAKARQSEKAGGEKKQNPVKPQGIAEFCAGNGQGG